jgi:hypothetical protein
MNNIDNPTESSQELQERSNLWPVFSDEENHVEETVVSSQATHGVLYSCNGSNIRYAIDRPHCIVSPSGDRVGPITVLFVLLGQARREYRRLEPMLVHQENRGSSAMSKSGLFINARQIATLWRSPRIISTVIVRVCRPVQHAPTTLLPSALLCSWSSRYHRGDTDVFQCREIIQQ